MLNLQQGPIFADFISHLAGLLIQPSSILGLLYSGRQPQTNDPLLPLRKGFRMAVKIDESFQLFR